MDKITSTTRLLGLIGNPVKGSLSPEFQNFVIDRLNLGYVYLAFSVEHELLVQAIEGLRALGTSGLNVTVPYKKAVFGEMDALSDSAKAVSAVNTVVFQENGELRGENTDWLGFIKSLERNGFEPRDKRCFVFGAGGAAAAVVYGLLRMNAGRIFIANRTLENARYLVDKLSPYSDGTDLNCGSLSWPGLSEELRESDLIVNATSVGMTGDEGKSICDDPAVFGSNQIVYDLIYNPSPTFFLQMASNEGARTIGGLEMLILQGLESLKLWTRVEFDSFEMLNDVKSFLR